MKSPWQYRNKWTWASLNSLLAATWGLQGAAVDVEEPRLLTLRPTEIYTAVDVEAEKESRLSAGSVATAVDRLYVAPVLGLGLKGSVYHPNLFQYDLHGEGGYGWRDINASPGTGASATGTESTFLQRYNVRAEFLASKPYSATFLADKIHTFREADFFNRVTVDSQSYGGRIGYSAGPVPVSLSFRHSEEDQSDVTLNSVFKQDTLELRARNERQSKNSTDLTYLLGEYDRRTVPVFNDHGIYHYASLYDIEKFGQHDRMVLSSTLTYNQVDNTTLPSKNFTATEGFVIDHSPTLQSQYDYSFNDFSSGPVETLSNYGRATLRHQLYESLGSSFDLHGDTIRTTAPGSSQNIWRYGLGLSEDYHKRLGGWGRLTLGNSVRLDHEQRESVGSVLNIVDERQTLKDSEVTFLKQPRVISVTAVTDLTATTNYVQGVDYELIPHGELTEIRRLTTSIDLPNGATVLVDYVATAQPSGAFATLSDQFLFRLDLFKGLVGLYSRLNWVENTHSDEFVLENTFNTQSGIDVSWRGLRGGGAYETRDSNLLTYRSVNLYESVYFEPAVGSTLSLDVRQRWATYPSEHRSIDDYSFIARYYHRLTPYLYCLIEGGVRVEKGEGTDQTQAAARTELDFGLGKLRVHLGYEYNNDDIRGELRQKHFLYLRAKRSF